MTRKHCQTASVTLIFVHWKKKSQAPPNIENITALVYQHKTGPFSSVLTSYKGGFDWFMEPVSLNSHIRSFLQCSCGYGLPGTSIWSRDCHLPDLKSKCHNWDLSKPTHRCAPAVHLGYKNNLSLSLRNGMQEEGKSGDPAPTSVSPEFSNIWGWGKSLDDSTGLW